MQTLTVLDRAREAFANKAWSAAYFDLVSADVETPLRPVDLERLALAAFLIGREPESDAARERAHRDYLATGDTDGAARAAFWLGLSLTLRGEVARGGGWFARAQRVLDEAGVAESVWHGYLLVPQAMNLVFGGDPASAIGLFDQAVAAADRYAEVDLRTLARHGRGQALVMSGDTGAGLRELDEVMVSVTTEAVSPQVVGLVYCAALETCRDSFDVRRGSEWAEALARWCAAQPDLIPYRGQCLVHRAELLQLHGSWQDAMADTQRACERLAQPPVQLALGMALYQRGELHRLRGEDDEAEAAYRAANQYGHDPQPGFALLRLAQGHVEPATAAITRALGESQRLTRRLWLLAAQVEIAIAAGDLPTARSAAEELSTSAATRAVPLLTAAALHATGAALLAAGEPRDALPVLRRAWAAWQDIAAPYDAARSRVLVGLACRALGDDDTAEMELDAARWVFEQLGAARDSARVAKLSRRRPGVTAPGRLTLREVQVLRLVATGATNRSIATDLFLSEKTVARHVANIFTKLDISSRSAATAYAYEHRLI